MSLWQRHAILEKNSIILVIGISLMRVGINWAGGGLPTLTKLVDGVPGAFPNPGYGQLQGRLRRRQRRHPP